MRRCDLLPWVTDHARSFGFAQIAGVGQTTLTPGCHHWGSQRIDEIRSSPSRTRIVLSISWRRRGIPQVLVRWCLWAWVDPVFRERNLGSEAEITVPGCTEEAIASVGRRAAGRCQAVAHSRHVTRGSRGADAQPSSSRRLDGISMVEEQAGRGQQRREWPARGWSRQEGLDHLLIWRPGQMAAR